MISFSLIDLFDIRLQYYTKSALVKIVSFSAGGLGFIIGYFGRKEDFWTNKYVTSYIDSYNRYPYIHKSFLSLLCIYIVAFVLSNLPTVFMSSYASNKPWITKQLYFDIYSWFSILIILLSLYVLTLWVFKRKHKNKKQKGKRKHRR